MSSEENETVEAASFAETVKIEEPVFSKAEVDALNLRIADLENRLTESENAYKEIADIGVSREKEIFKLMADIENRDKKIAELEEAHEMMNAAIDEAAGGKFGRIDVPAMVNKQRVVAACLEVEKNATCAHVADFIAAVRLYIDPDSGK